MEGTQSKECKKRHWCYNTLVCQTNIVSFQIQDDNPKKTMHDSFKDQIEIIKTQLKQLKVGESTLEEFQAGTKNQKQMQILQNAEVHEHVGKQVEIMMEERRCKREIIEGAIAPFKPSKKLKEIVQIQIM